MSGEISKVGGLATPATMPAQTEKLAGDQSKAREVLSKALEVLSGANVLVTKSNETVTGTAEKKTAGAANVPSLDNPGDVKQLQANLEKLIAYLQMDNEERQAAMAKDRIEINKESYKTEHKDRKEKIEKTLNDMEKAEKASKRNKIFGWLMTGLAILGAVIACVATGGLAVGAVVGAGVALAMQVLNETGVMGKLTEKLAGALEKAGLSKEAAQVLAAVIVTVAAIALSIASGAGASALASRLGSAAQTAVQTTANVANAAAKTASTMATTLKAGAEAIKPAVTIGTRILQLAGIGMGAEAAYKGYTAGISQSETTETEKTLAMLRQRMEESEEELEAILQAIESSISGTAQLLASATETSGEIARNIGQMA